MPPSILTVTLNPAIDKIITLPKFKTGTDFRAQDIILNAGGKGLNVSRALKNLGMKSLATGFLAGSNGELLSEKLCTESIDQRFLKIKGEARTNLTIIEKRSKMITRILEQGPKIGPADWKKFKENFARHLKGKKFVVFCGSNAWGLKDLSYHELIEMAHKKDVKTVLDTSGQPLKKAIKSKPYLIKPNLEEAEFAIGKKLRTISAIKQAIHYFHQLGVRVVIVSLGGKGAMASDGKCIYRAIAPNTSAYHNVGCGDVLIAGFLYGELRGWDFKRSFKWAVACGSANTLSECPGGIRLRQVKQLLSYTKVEQLND